MLSNAIFAIVVILSHYFLPGNALILSLFKGKLLDDKFLNVLTVILTSIILSLAINAVLALALGNPRVGLYNIRITTLILLIMSLVLYSAYFIRVKALWKLK